MPARHELHPELSICLSAWADLCGARSILDDCTVKGGDSVPPCVIQTHGSRAGIQVRPFRPGFYTPITDSIPRLLSYRVASYLSHRTLARTQSSAGRLHRYIKQRTQESVRVGAKAADYLSSGFEISLRGALELALIKATIRDYTTHLQVSCHHTSTGLNWPDTRMIIRTRAKINRRVTNARPSPQSETKYTRAEANQGNDSVQEVYR